ncbi:MAG TPA: hypothetical protein VFO83_07410, partial [Aggregicoccus sp.]|nr:hypothetical protein [Aggregicoccus sp.]
MTVTITGRAHDVRPCPSGSRRWTMWSAVVLCGLLAACSSSTPAEEEAAADARTSGQVGAGGGSVDLANVATVKVGAGALPSELTVSVAVVREPPVAPPGERASEVVELTPHGTSFSVPARVALRYTPGAAGEALRVWRLSSPATQRWEPVGGARFEDGRATFDTTTFSYYVVVRGDSCPVTELGTSCGSGCNCCGGAQCVDTAVDPRHCGGCGVACAADSFCAAGAAGTACKALATATLCENARLYVLRGQLPDLEVVTPEQLADGASADRIASAIAQECGLSPTSVHEAAQGVLDACTDAPLYWSGSTVLMVGGGFSQRLSRAMDANHLSPLYVSQDTQGYAFRKADGTLLTQFPGSALTPRHDYFVISLYPDPQRGALILHVYGMGWEGTPAA